MDWSKLVYGATLQGIRSITIVMPDTVDEQRTYLMQSYDKWYLVRDCCRSCATRHLQAWTTEEGVKTVETPAWLIELGRDE